MGTRVEPSRPQTIDHKEFAAMMAAFRAGGGCICGSRRGQRRRSSKTAAVEAEAEARVMAPLFEQKTATSDPGRCARPHLMAKT